MARFKRPHASDIQARQRIADGIRRARVANEQTLQEVADVLKVHLHTYYRWETGMTSIPAELFSRVAKAVKKDTIELLVGAAA